MKSSNAFLRCVGGKRLFFGAILIQVSRASTGGNEPA